MQLSGSALFLAILAFLASSDVSNAVPMLSTAAAAAKSAGTPALARGASYLAVVPKLTVCNPIETKKGNRYVVVKIGDAKSDKRVDQYKGYNTETQIAYNDSDGEEKGNGKKLENETLKKIANAHRTDQTEWYRIWVDKAKNQDTCTELEALLKKYPDFKLNEESGLTSAATAIKTALEKIAVPKPADEE